MTKSDTEIVELKTRVAKLESDMATVIKALSEFEKFSNIMQRNFEIIQNWILKAEGQPEGKQIWPPRGSDRVN